mgnify:CR=1 FL=1
MAKVTAIASQGPDDWECEEDLRTLIRAKEIEKDPKRFAKAKELAKKKMMDAAAVASKKKKKRQHLNQQQSGPPTRNL